jgi:hypothetical protein
MTAITNAAFNKKAAFQQHIALMCKDKTDCHIWSTALFGAGAGHFGKWIRMSFERRVEIIWANLANEKRTGYIRYNEGRLTELIKCCIDSVFQNRLLVSS